jgi:23S rRNA pseudouridine2605 synthase
MLDGKMVFVDAISYIENESKTEVGIEIHSGRNRIVRKIFEHFGYTVIKLDRVIFAGLTKKNLPRGHWRLLTEQEIINLKML